MTYEAFTVINDNLTQINKVVWWLNWWHKRKCDVVEVNDAKYNVNTLERLYDMLIEEKII